MRSEAPAGWRTATLGSICEDVRYGYTASAQDQPLGPRFLRITDIVGKLEWSSVPFCEASPEDCSKYEVRTGDIVIARTGASAGTAHYCDPLEPTVFASYLVRFRVDSQKANARFVGYVLRSPAWWSYVSGASAGSAQPQLNAQVMRSFAFHLPPLTEQGRIASVLAALDDKIDSNRRLAALLEETAATLFRARFVDFVGVEEFEESEIGRVPRGWRLQPLGEALRVVGGSTPSTKESRFWSGAHCWATPKDLAGARSPVLLDTSRHITEDGVAQISSKLLPIRTVLLSSRAPVGYTTIAFVPIAVNQGFIAIPPTDGIPSEFVLFWLREHLDTIKAHAGGTTFAEISKRQFRPLPIVLPPRELLHEFADTACPMFDLIANLEGQSATLAAVRDALLPKLISGAIRVPDTRDPAEVIEPAAAA